MEFERGLGVADDRTIADIAGYVHKAYLFVPRLNGAQEFSLQIRDGLGLIKIAPRPHAFDSEVNEKQPIDGIVIYGTHGHIRFCSPPTPVYWRGVSIDSQVLYCFYYTIRRLL